MTSAQAWRLGLLSRDRGERRRAHSPRAHRSQILAVGRACVRRKEVACYRRDEEALASSNDGTMTAGLDGRSRAAPSPVEIDVALAGDVSVYAGLVGAVTSVLRTTPRARIHVIVEKEGDLERAMECVDPQGSKIRAVVFDRARVSHLILKAPTGRAYGNLESPLNFARFYLAELLPEARTVVYLDADVVVLSDLADLVAALPKQQPFALAAVPRSQQPCYASNVSRPGMFYCDDLKNQRLFERKGVQPERLESFNAGVAVFDLDVWRSKGLAKRAEFWIKQHANRPLWRLGSNPPLILAVHGLFVPIADPTWNCDGLGWKKIVHLDAACLERGARIWHWSGPRKPWLRAGHYKALWWPHLEDPTCLTSLPPAPIDPLLDHHKSSP